MIANASTDRTPVGSGTAGSAAPPEPAVPPWWCASSERFGRLAETRLQIHRREKAAARKAVSVIAAGLAAAASIYSVDTAGAMGILPAAPGFLTFFATVAVPTAVAWLLDRRLLQQLGDIRLRSQLWLDLVEAVRDGCIDVPQLEFPPRRETDVESFLRREAILAARFLASRRTLTPHLPILGHCFTLENN